VCGGISARHIYRDGPEPGRQGGGGADEGRTELELVSEALLPLPGKRQASQSLEETRLAAWWQTGSSGQLAAAGTWPLCTYGQCYTLRCARDPATQRPSTQRFRDWLQPPASSLQPPTSGSLLPSTPLPQCSTAHHLGFAEFLTLELGAWGLSVPLLLVSSHSRQYARPAPESTESRQTPERATNLMIPNRPPQTSPCGAHHLASPLLSVTSPCPRPCRRRLSAPTRDYPPPAHSSLSPTTNPGSQLRRVARSRSRIARVAAY
jgi:hypothetical protein